LKPLCKEQKRAVLKVALLTFLRMAKAQKAATILVKLLSSAGTGYF
jgi:hypothetical protein